MALLGSRRQAWLLLLAAAIAATFTAPASALNINGVECPDNTTTLAPGGDLSGIQAGITYYLPAGVPYTVSASVINPAEGDTLCLVGLGSDRSQVQITLYAIVAAVDISVGIQGLTLAGSGQPGVGLVVVNQSPSVNATALGISDVSITRFTAQSPVFFVDMTNITITNTTVSDNVGAQNGAGLFVKGVAVRPNVVIDNVEWLRNRASSTGGAFNFENADVVINRARFEDNQASAGGALSALDSTLKMHEVNFTQCEAQFGGVLFVRNTDTTIEGPVTIRGCKATDGGALAILGSTVKINGALCATNNTAANNGAFAFLSGVLEVPSGADVQVGNNTPTSSTLFVGGAGSVIKCGADSTAWASAQVYSVQGPLCACSAAFEAGNSTTCNACGNRGWDVDTCGCVPPECEAGVCCDVANTTFLPNGTGCAYNPLDSNAFAPFRRAKVNDAGAGGRSYDGGLYFYYPYARRGDGGREDSPPYEDDDDAPNYFHRDSPYSTGDSYDPRPDMPPYYKGDSEPPYGSHDWPMCYGSCSLGQCVLDKTEPGCCYVAEKPYDSNSDAPGYAKQLSAGEGYDGGRYENKEDGSENLLCWKTSREWHLKKYDSGY